MVRAKQEMCIEHWMETGLRLSNGDMVFGLIRPLTADIDYPPYY